MEYSVLYYNINTDEFQPYNVLRNEEKTLKRFKRICSSKENFADLVKREFMYHFWAKCEWEMVISITEDGRVVLSPWIGKEGVEKDVTDEKGFAWKEFARRMIGEDKREAKVDVWNQIAFCWDKFVDYCWNC